jgi:hypothetical protein
MILRFVVDVHTTCFGPTWPSSSVNDISLFIPEKQRSRFLQEYKSETSYTPEDGHAGRNM